jgi:ATP-dependent DNA helicase RecG
MGIQKMKAAMVAAGLREPAFASDAFFQATFQRSPELALKEGKEGSEARFREKLGGSEQLVERLVEGLAERLAENQRMILGLIIRNPRMSKKAMAEAVGISTTAIDKNLTKLKRIGILRRVGPDKGGHWEVVHQKAPHGHGK